MPTVSDLDAAMMQATVSVPAVRRLGGGTVRLNDAGRPLRATGRDAVIYELRAPTGRILALRTLPRANARQFGPLAQRYRALHDDRHLDAMRQTSGLLPRDIQWIADGIVVPGPDPRGTPLPLMVMERVPGRTVARVVDRLCHAGEANTLALLADRWLEAAAALETLGFTHGDLAADNLIVRPDGSIALIDLDTADWPSAPSVDISNTGTPGYSHPRGAPRDPGLRDRFPALIIWASLRILARHPDLRQRWGDPPDRIASALLWSEEDLRRLAQSPLLASLEALNDPVLQPLLEVLRRAVRFSPEETPPLVEIASRLDQLGFPSRATSPGSLGKSTRRTVSGTPPPEGPRGATRHDDARPRQWPGSDRTHRPAALQPDARAAASDLNAEKIVAAPADHEQRATAVKEIAAALAARDAKSAMALWDASRTVPEAAAYGAAVHQLVSAEVTAAVERAIRRNDDAGLIATIAEADRAGIASSSGARAAVRDARIRVEARSSLQDAAATNDYAAIATMKLLGKLDGLGHLDPAHARAVSRALAWPTLQRALERNDDEAIAAAADPALWREESTLPDNAWPRLDLARRRLRWLEDVRAALRRRDGPVLRGLLAGAPPGAEDRLTEVESRRILRITMREAAVARLERALREGPDREVVAASSSPLALRSPMSSTGRPCVESSTGSHWPMPFAPPPRKILPIPRSWLVSCPRRVWRLAAAA